MRTSRRLATPVGIAVNAGRQDRSAYRQGVQATVRSARVGFRVAREL